MVTPIAAVKGAKKYQPAAPWTSQALLALGEVAAGAQEEGRRRGPAPGSALGGSDD